MAIIAMYGGMQSDIPQPKALSQGCHRTFVVGECVPITLSSLKVKSAKKRQAVISAR